MAALLTLIVEKNDGSRDVYTVKPLSLVAFERQFGTGVASLQTSGRMEYIYWLAWHAVKTSGEVVKPFDEWLNGIASVESEDDAVPLEAATIPSS